MRTKMAARLHLATAQAEHSAYNIAMAKFAPRPPRRLGKDAETVFEIVFITVFAPTVGFALSWLMDWYYWERDIVGLGSQVMYLQQATESWVVGTGIGVTLAVALAYGFYRLHKLRGD